MSDKPALLLDVDGPLNPYQAPYGGPPGYIRHRIGGLTVRLNPQHGEKLLALADRYELFWCTAWEHQANTEIAPLIGLPELPVIALGNPYYGAPHIWKFPHVKGWAGARPFVWLDDEFTREDKHWAAVRTVQIADTSFIDVPPETGLTDEHFEMLRSLAL